MNKFQLLGRLSKDPWIAKSEKVIKLSIAVNRDYSKEKAAKVRAEGGKTADFFEVTLFNNKNAFKWVAESVHKGDGIFVEGVIQNEEPRDCTDRQGLPLRISKDSYICRKIEITNQKDGYHGEITVEDEENVRLDSSYEEEDPINTSTTAFVDDDSEW